MNTVIIIFLAYTDVKVPRNLSIKSTSVCVSSLPEILTQMSSLFWSSIFGLVDGAVAPLKLGSFS